MIMSKKSICDKYEFDGAASPRLDGVMPVWDSISPQKDMVDAGFPRRCCMPSIFKFNDSVDFARAFSLDARDVIVTSRSAFNPYFGEMGLSSRIVFLDAFDPSSSAELDTLYREVGGSSPGRVVGVGGGSVLAAAKLLGLKMTEGRAGTSFWHEDSLRKTVLVPAVCSAPGEMVNSVIVTRVGGGMKRLVHDDLYSDSVVLIPQLLEALNYVDVVSDSMTAFVRSAEAFFNPDAQPHLLCLAAKSIRMLCFAFRSIAVNGEFARIPFLGDFLVASNYAGTAFGNQTWSMIDEFCVPFLRIAGGNAGRLRAEVLVAVLSTMADGKLSGSLSGLFRTLSDSLDCGMRGAPESLGCLLNAVLPFAPPGPVGFSRAVVERSVEAVRDGLERTGFLRGFDFGDGVIAEVFRTLL